jgi:hypothetical protein
MENECPHTMGMGPPHNSMGPSQRPSGGVAKVSMTPPFHTQVLYHTFLSTQTSQSMEYCEICWTHRHALR